MTAVQRRFRSVIRRIGDTFTVGGNSRTGVFTVLSPGYARWFIPQTDIDIAGRPLRLAYVPYDDATVETDVVSWDGLSLTVKKVVKARHAGSTVAKMLILA